MFTKEGKCAMSLTHAAEVFMSIYNLSRNRSNGLINTSDNLRPVKRSVRTPDIFRHEPNTAARVRAKWPL